jgi:uncharacterized membrane protein YdjX (TVP38/TMEM64 family)
MRRVLLAALLLGATFVLWRVTPLSSYLDPHRLANAATALRGMPLAALIVPAAFVVLGLFMFPLMALKLATILVFGPLWGTIYALTGTAASALVGHTLGGAVGRDAVARLAGPRVDRIRARLARSGVIAIALFRMLPLAPFALENMIAGAAGIRRRRFLAGTMLATIPAIILIVCFREGMALAH